MEGSAFAGWTRRRFGRLTGGGVATVLGWSTAADARKKRRRKRCKKLGDICTSGGKRRCCGRLRCDKTLAGNPSVLCCKGEGESCNDHIECCDDLGCIDRTCEFQLSDRARKAGFATVDPADMLRRVGGLPISTWNYTNEEPSVRHIGPMAQDFAALFRVGADDRHIHVLDGQGVALSAIQGLIADLEQLRRERDTLAARVTSLERRREERS
jgi:hypothetical protein